MQLNSTKSQQNKGSSTLPPPKANHHPAPKWEKKIITKYMKEKKVRPVGKAFHRVSASRARSELMVRNYG